MRSSLMFAMLGICASACWSCGGGGGGGGGGSAPAAPGGLGATGGDAKVSLSWSASSGATSYKVERGSTHGGPYTDVGSPSGTSYDDTGLSGGTTYFYVVRAVNSSGTSDPSNEATALTVPAAPTGVTASGGNGSATVSWTASPGAASYVVKRGAAASGPFTQVGTPAATTYADSGLAAGTTYYYVVSAANASGAGAASAAASTITIPATPTGVTATGGNQSVHLSWTATQGAAGYSVRRGAAAGGPFSQVGTPSQNAYDDASVAAGTTYYYVIAATNASGASAQSAVANAMTLAPAVSDLAATAGNQQVSLSWTATTGAASYDVYQSTTHADPNPTLVTNVAAPPYVVTGLTNGTAYYFVVKAKNASGSSAASNEAASVPGAPSAPTLGGSAGNASNSLSWNTVSGAVSYSLRRAATSGGAYTQIAFGASLTSYSDTSVVNDTTYYYVVVAANNVGESPNSNELALTPHGPLAAPVLTAVGANASVHLTWPAVTRAVSYDIKRSTTSGSGYSTIASAVTATSYVDSGVSNGTKYYYVAVSNGSGEPSSGNSSEVSATPAREICFGSYAPYVHAVDADASGYTAIRRSFGGSSLVLGPLSIFVDATNSEVYAVDSLSGSITVYSSSARNDAAPVRVLSGLSTPIAVAVDPVHNELFVVGGSDPTTEYLQVFDRTASGAASAKRTLDPGVLPSGVFVDTASSEVYVSGVGAVSVWPLTWTSAPSGSYLGPVSAPSYSGVAVTGTSVFVSTSDNPAELDVYLRSDFSPTATPPQAPQRSITGLTPIDGIALDSLSSEVFVVLGSMHELVAYPQSWASAPTGRTITLPSTDTPRAAWVDAANANLWFAVDNPSNYLGVMDHSAASFGGAAIVSPATPDAVALALDATHSNLWVARFASGGNSYAATYSEFAKSGTTSYSTQVAVTAQGIAYNATDSEVYVSDGVGTVAVLSPTGADLGTSFAASQPGSLWYDGGELFVYQATDHSVSVYTRSAGGTFTFNRALAGSNTGFNVARAVYADATELLVATGNKILVFPRTWSGTVNVAPSRTITTPASFDVIGGVVKDGAGNIFAGAGFGPQATIYAYPAGAGAGTSPTRTIYPIGAGDKVKGLAFCN